MAKLSEAFRFTSKPRELKTTDYEMVPFIPMEMVPLGEYDIAGYEEKAGESVRSGTYVEAGDLLLAKITPSFENGKQGFVRDLPTPFAYATTEVWPIQAIPGLGDLDYLFHYLLRTSVRELLAGKMEGSTGRQRLSKGTLADLEIILPPLEEQRRIAKALRAIQEAASARRAELELERERKAALLQHLLTNGTKGEPTKETEIGEMPESWDVVPIGSLADNVQYGTSEKCSEDRIGFPVLRIPNVIGGEVDQGDLKWLEITEDAAEKYILREGDLLFVRTNGQKHLIGRSAVYKGLPASSLFASYLIRVQFEKASEMSNFLQCFLETNAARQQIEEKANSAADGKFNLNGPAIKSILVPLPDEQERPSIVAVREAMNKKIRALESEVQILEQLFSATLEQLLEGEEAPERLDQEPTAMEEPCRER